MSKRLLYFFLLNIVYFVLVVAIYAVGYEYDKAHKLYPELISFSYHTLGYGYGQRWMRFLKYAVWFGILSDAVIGYIWYRRTQRQAEGSLTIK